MTRKQLDAEPQPERSSPEAPIATDQREPAAGYSTRRGSRSLLRDLNVSLLIELVRRAGTVSRADLARQSRLSAPTVSNIVDKLIKRGIFNEVSSRRRAAVAPRPPQHRSEGRVRDRDQVACRWAYDGGL